MATADNYPAWAITAALERGYDHPAHIRALQADDLDAISTTHPYNWLTEEEVESIPHWITVEQTLFDNIPEHIWQGDQNTRGQRRHDLAHRLTEALRGTLHPYETPEGGHEPAPTDR